MATQTLRSTAASYRLEGKVAIITGGEDLAGVAAFLASADSDDMTGTTVLVDGGLLWSYEQ